VAGKSGKAAGRWAFLAALLLLAGCAAPPPPGWSKPGISTAEASRDLTACERYATGPAGFHFRALNQSYEEARDEIPRRRAACLSTRGWREEK
jgi:hypothetical protein